MRSGFSPHRRSIRTDFYYLIYPSLYKECVWKMSVLHIKILRQWALTKLALTVQHCEIVLKVVFGWWNVVILVLKSLQPNYYPELEPKLICCLKNFHLINVFGSFQRSSPNHLWKRTATSFARAALLLLPPPLSSAGRFISPPNPGLLHPSKVRIKDILLKWGNYVKQ